MIDEYDRAAVGSEFLDEIAQVAQRALILQMGRYVEQNDELSLRLIDEVIERGRRMLGIGNGHRILERGIVQSARDRPGPQLNLIFNRGVDDEMKGFLFLKSLYEKGRML